MKIYLKDIQNTLSKQDYLTFDKVLSRMYETIECKKSISVLGEREEPISELKSFDQVEEWKKKMIEIYGLFGLI